MSFICWDGFFKLLLERTFCSPNATNISENHVIIDFQVFLPCLYDSVDCTALRGSQNMWKREKDASPGQKFQNDGERAPFEPSAPGATEISYATGDIASCIAYSHMYSAYICDIFYVDHYLVQGLG